MAVSTSGTHVGGMDSEIQLGSREGITVWKTDLPVCSMDNLEETEATSLIIAECLTWRVIGQKIGKVLQGSKCGSLVNAKIMSSYFTLYVK